MKVMGEVFLLRSRQGDSGAQCHFWRGNRDLDGLRKREGAVSGSRSDVKAEIWAENAAGAVFVRCFFFHGRVSSRFVRC